MIIFPHIGATTLATAAGALAVMFGIALLVREILATRRRAEQLALDGAALAAVYRELEATKAQANATTALLEAALSGMSDGVMMLDADLRMMQWNERFASFTGVPVELLRVGVPMETLIRAQAEAGEFGPVDPEAETRRRMALLRSARRTGVFERQRPNGRTIELRRRLLSDGGLVTLYSDITARKQAEAVPEEVSPSAAPPAAAPPAVAAMPPPAASRPPPPAAGVPNEGLPDEGLIDATRLADLQRGLPQGLFRSLAEQCFDDIRVRMAGLRRGLEELDATVVSSEAHALAGMAGGYGLAGFERRMRAIMRASGAGDLATATVAAEGIDHLLDRSAETLRALLRAPPP